MMDVSQLTKAQARQMILARDRLDFIDMFVDIGAASGDEESRALHPNQIFCIGDWHNFQCVEKGRQEGHSFGFSLDSVARAALEPRSMSVHISTDKWEAQKKQIYCLRILDSMKESAKAHCKIISESKNRLEFENGSLIDFLACRPPRGADRAGIYLDEMAFMPNVEQILKAALGCTTHGGYIRAGSTHCGSAVEFYKIARNIEDEWGNKPYSFWSRNSFPWWSCPSLCIDIDRAALEAPNMETAERVEKFGKENLKIIFKGYPLLSDFQEEFECVVVDEAHAFFPMSLIAKCFPPKGIDEVFEYRPCYGGEVDALGPAREVIHSLKRAVQQGKIPGALYVAMDIGRKIDNDEITIGSDFNNSLCLRGLISMSDMPFEKKEIIWHHIMEELPIVKGYIDATGGSMGVHMGEKMFAKYGQRAMPFQFTNESKSNLANDVKIRMERGGLILPEPLPPLVRQIHSIKKSVTLHGHVTYGVEENKEHHGDKFWSLAMLCGLASQTPEIYSFPIEVLHRQNQYGVPNRARMPERGKILLPGMGGFYAPKGVIR